MKLIMKLEYNIDDCVIRVTSYKIIKFLVI